MQADQKLGLYINQIVDNIPANITHLKLGDYLICKDPLLIEHDWQTMYNTSNFRGAAIMGAISAIDIAFWDIAGKNFQVPVYQLLGGKVRD